MRVHCCARARAPRTTRRQREVTAPRRIRGNGGRAGIVFLLLPDIMSCYIRNTRNCSWLYKYYEIITTLFLRIAVIYVLLLEQNIETLTNQLPTYTISSNCSNHNYFGDKEKQKAEQGRSLRSLGDDYVQQWLSFG